MEFDRVVTLIYEKFKKFANESIYELFQRAGGEVCEISEFIAFSVLASAHLMAFERAVFAF